MTLNFLKHVPVSTDPCGRLQYGIPNNNTEHQGAGEGRLHDQREPAVAVRALLLRGLRQPGDLRRQQRADAEPHRPEQPGALAGRRPQPGALVVDAQLAARDVQPDAERSAAAAVLQRHRSRRARSPAWCRATSASASPATASRSAPAPPTRATSTPTGWQIADDVDLIRGNHQFSVGGNWIHSRIETLNNRPTNGAFTFNGQSTGLSLADFMVGAVSGGFLQGNPVYDYDHSDYVGAYAQDNWRVRSNLTLNLGLRWEPFLPVQNTYSLGEPLRSGAVRSERPQHGLSAGAGRPDVPRRLRVSGRRGTTFGKMAQFAPRVGVVWTPNGDERTSVRASWGVFYDTPHLFFNTRFANNPPWGAQITISNPPGGFADPYLGYPGRQPVPGAEHRMGDAAVPGVRRLREHAAASRADVAAAVERQRAAPDRRLAGRGELSRQPLEPSLARDRAESGGLRTGRDDRQHQPAPRA